MRHLITFCAFMISGSVMAQMPSIVDAPVNHLFVPEGFDNNDNVEVVVTGEFPNPCFSTNKVEVDVKGDDVFITITALAKQDNNSRLCEDLKVPFTEVVRIGNLQAGTYQLFVNQGSSHELRGKMSIAVSNSNSVDDHLYAQVDYIELGITGGLSGDALLIGSTLSPCMQLDKVEYISNKADTFSVLPVMKRIGRNCPERKTRLEIPIKFKPQQLASSKVLLFVRSIEGKSVHTIIDKE